MLFLEITNKILLVLEKEEGNMREKRLIQCGVVSITIHHSSCLDSAVFSCCGVVFMDSCPWCVVQVDRSVL